MDILSRRLYNGGFNHLKRRTGSLILGIPRVVVQPPQLRVISTLQNMPQMKTRVEGDNGMTLDTLACATLSEHPHSPRLVAEHAIKSTEEGHKNCIHAFLSSHRTTSTLSSEHTMPAHQEWVETNNQYAAAFGEKSKLPLAPGKKLAIVTCMDARINVYAELGINEGDAHIIRNAGGSAKDALRSIIVSQRLLGTREIAVFHHTDCGMLTFTTPELRKLVKDSDPSNPSLDVVDEIDFLEFSELEKSIQSDVEYLKTNPLVLKETVVTGWVYDVETGKIRQVV